MRKQVDKSHYEFNKYVHKKRWASIWHQLDEVAKLKPESILEIGPGPGLFKAVARAIGLHIETLDLDSELSPDHIASALDIPFQDEMFDVVCAFQMLEHLPFEKSVEAFREMARVARKAIIISLPDSATRWPISVHIPCVGLICFTLPKPRLMAPYHKFDGEHYWEINKAGYPLKRVSEMLLRSASVRLQRTFRVHEHPYHRFFIFEKTVRQT